MKKPWLREGFGAMARLTAVSAAFSADFRFDDVDLGLGPERGVHEFQGEVVAQVRAALGPGARPAAAAEAEEALEDVSEAGEDILEPAESRKAGAFEPGMAELVVDTSFFTVPQDLVGFGGLLELLFGFLVAGVAVGMELERQLAVGGFELVVGCLAVDAQDLVVIPFLTHGFLLSLVRSGSLWPPGRFNGSSEGWVTQ